MALAAESATGILLGMSVPDSRMPLCKSMAVDFTRIAKGGNGKLGLVSLNSLYQ